MSESTDIMVRIKHPLFRIFCKHEYRLFKKPIDKIPNWISCIITFIFVNFAWVLFRSNSFQDFKGMIHAISKNECGLINENICSAMQPEVVNILTGYHIPYYLGAIFMLSIVLVIVFKCRNVQEKAFTLKYTFASALWVLSVLIISILSFSGVSTFVYNMF